MDIATFYTLRKHKYFSIMGKGSIAIRLDKEHYFPGENVHALVCIDIPVQIKANALVLLEVKGYEMTRWTEGIGKSLERSLIHV